jgi:hypothetical protein
VIIVLDFVCVNGHRTERFVRPETVAVPCPVCSMLAERVISAPRALLDGTSGHFPGASDSWERKRESHMAKERRNMRDHGEYLNGRPCND